MRGAVSCTVSTALSSLAYQFSPHRGLPGGVIRISYAFSTERACAMRVPAVWLLGGTGILWLYHNSIICARSEARLRALYNIVSLSHKAPSTFASGDVSPNSLMGV
eukprot:2054763-Pyramimonas_sp.AAC.1